MSTAVTLRTTTKMNVAEAVDASDDDTAASAAKYRARNDVVENAAREVVAVVAPNASTRNFGVCEESRIEIDSSGRTDRRWNLMKRETSSYSECRRNSFDLILVK